MLWGQELPLRWQKDGWNCERSFCYLFFPITLQVELAPLFFPVVREHRRSCVDNPQPELIIMNSLLRIKAQKCIVDLKWGIFFLPREEGLPSSRFSLFVPMKSFFCLFQGFCFVWCQHVSSTDVCNSREARACIPLLPVSQSIHSYFIANPN